MRKWNVKGYRGAQEVVVQVKAPSHAAARRAAVMQGIGPRDVILIDRQSPAQMRRKAIRAFAALAKSA